MPGRFPTEVGTTVVVVKLSLALGFGQAKKCRLVFINR